MKKINGAKVALLSMDSLNENGKELRLNIDTTRSDKPYFFKIDFEKKYKVAGSKEGYLNGS